MICLYITNNLDNIDFGHIDIDLLILMLIMFYQLPVQLCLNITKILEILILILILIAQFKWLYV